ARTGRTLVDLLDALRAEHGEIRNTQVSVAYPGATGQDRLATLLDGLRTTPPTEIGGRAVVSWTDLQDETGRMGRFVSRSDRAARNVLVAKLAAGDPEIDEGARVILRPSGTEPKLKVYVEVLGRPRLDAPARRRVDDATAALATAVRAWLA
ncbi:MAG: hypothetical protein ABMB14_23370, partial [Myxococcota bacterium]